MAPAGFSARHREVMVPGLQGVVPVKQDVAEGGVSSKHGGPKHHPHPCQDGQTFLHARDFVVMGDRDLLQAHDVCAQLPDDAHPPIKVPSAVRAEPLVHVVCGERQFSHDPGAGSRARFVREASTASQRSRSEGASHTTRIQEDR